MDTTSTSSGRRSLEPETTYDTYIPKKSWISTIFNHHSYVDHLYHIDWKKRLEDQVSKIEEIPITEKQNYK